MTNFLDKLIKISLYSLVFFTPLFFLPFTVWPVSLNKQIFLIFLALFSLILWLVKIIASGELKLRHSKISLSVLILLAFLGASTIFSSSRLQSFWGMNQEADSYLNFILFALVFFLFANLVEGRKEILNVLSLFLASSGILSLFFLVQNLFKKPFFSWPFAQSTFFNPIGTTQGLSLFLGAALVILLALVTTAGLKLKNKKDISAKKNFSKPKEEGKKHNFISRLLNLKWFKPLMALSLGILIFVSILLINHWLVWFGISLAMIIIMAEATKSIGESFSSKELKKLILPLGFLAFSLVFVFVRPSLSGLLNVPPEISPTVSMTLEIAIKTLKESLKNLFFGTGLATWEYQFSLYRPVLLNLTDFWQIRFSQGSGILVTLLATSGVLGVLAFLAIISLFLYQGMKMIFGKEKEKKSANGEEASSDLKEVKTVLFSTGLYLFFLFFFYPLNFSLGMAAFIILGLWASIFYQKETSFSFTQSPQKAFFVMLLGVGLVAGSIMCLFKVSQKYKAALVYSEGISLINSQEPKLDKGIEKINQAVLLDKKDIYLRNLSQAFLLKINEVLSDQSLAQEKKQEKLQQLIAGMEEAASTATSLNPKNSENWLGEGNIYDNLVILGVEGADELAISYYQKAGEFDPQNPLVPFFLGRLHKRLAEKNIADSANQQEESAKKQLEEKANQNFVLTLEDLNKSVSLKPNFSSAYYFLAQTYEEKGEKEKALANYQIVLQLEPGNEEIKKKVEELTK